ncbi:glycerol-3-phosphate dehydrogenase [Legionella israelensis]|uniref:glycerol-3-phosphate dehydrogenase n=1 Tax=Legionella israelensis TaxID=454 RepID=UPI00117CF5C5|nr:glycerol-3-phosphate dehydrogenase [Legionella israelensis]QDP72651.1 glycerol-3-phosphate dehydrogenase [Legionella israelensis]
MEPLYDVAVIGGGINGCGCAADAALRGLSVFLCEKGDIASQTSSKSTKLIHGGLRYLEQYNFKLVKKALIERQKLFELAPYLVHPIQLMLPYEKFLRPSWLIRTGLFIYDHLSQKNNLPKSRSIHRKNQSGYFQPLKNRFYKGFLFYDGSTNDSRLTLVNAIQAKEHGARICTHTELIQAKTENNQWYLTLKDHRSDSLINIQAKTVINATGPWIDSVSKRLNISENKQVVWVKGSHIVVPQLYEGNHAYFLQSKDKRIIFTIPYYGYTMIGTTDIQFSGSLDDVEISPSEVAYLCDLSNQYFNKSINKNMIINSWSGVRPLIKDKEKQLHTISRDYHFNVHEQPAPAITIYGGKITTYRKLAAEVIDKLDSVFPDLPISQTANHPLPGAELNGMSFEDYEYYATEHYSWLEQKLLKRYLDNYGTRAEYILKHCQSMDDLGIYFGHGLYQVELDYLLQQEWATSCDDILWRRTKLGLDFDNDNTLKLEKYINLYHSNLNSKMQILF